MTRTSWEYLGALSAGLDVDALNDLGADGWEVLQVLPGPPHPLTNQPSALVLLKRQQRDDNPPRPDARGGVFVVDRARAVRE